MNRPGLRRPRGRGGFTMVELIVTMIIVGVLAAITLPRLSNSGTGAAVFADRIVATLVLAQKTAVTHRRLVCVDTAARSLTLSIALANPAVDCGKTAADKKALEGQDPADSSTSDTAISASGTNGLIGTTLFFRPNGTIALKDTGAAAQGTITVSVAGETNPVRTITIDGRTGYVDYAD